MEFWFQDSIVLDRQQDPYVWELSSRWIREDKAWRVITLLDMDNSSKSQANQLVCKRKYIYRGSIRVVSLEHAFGFKREVFLDLLAGLQVDVRDHMAIIHDAFQNRDMDEIRSRAHAVKWATSFFGTILISEAAKKLEQAADSGRLDQLPTLINSLTEAIKDLPEIIQMIQSLEKA